MALKTEHKAILYHMFYYRRFLTTKEIAKAIGYSWQTIDKRLEELLKKKFVVREREGKRVRWKFNHKYYQELKEQKII